MAYDYDYGGRGPTPATIILMGIILALFTPFIVSFLSQVLNALEVVPHRPRDPYLAELYDLYMAQYQVYKKGITDPVTVAILVSIGLVAIGFVVKWRGGGS